MFGKGFEDGPKTSFVYTEFPLEPKLEEQPTLADHFSSKLSKEYTIPHITVGELDGASSKKQNKRDLKADAKKLFTIEIQNYAEVNETEIVQDSNEMSKVELSTLLLSANEM